MGERGHRHLPALADPPDQVLRRHVRVGEKHLVKRRVAIHLFERLHVYARLLYVDHEIRQPLMLGRIPIRAGQQQAVIGMMGAGGPDLLAVDEPIVAVQIRTGGGASEVRAAARLTEELAPGVFPGENAAQKPLFLPIRAVLEQRRRRQQPHSGFRHPDGADASEFLFHRAHEAQR